MQKVTIFHKLWWHRKPFLTTFLKTVKATLTASVVFSGYSQLASSGARPHWSFWDICVRMKGVPQTRSIFPGSRNYMHWAFTRVPKFTRRLLGRKSYLTFLNGFLGVSTTFFRRDGWVCEEGGQTKFWRSVSCFGRPITWFGGFKVKHNFWCEAGKKNGWWLRDFHQLGKSQLRKGPRIVGGGAICIRFFDVALWKGP